MLGPVSASGYQSPRRSSRWSVRTPFSNLPSAVLLEFARMSTEESRGDWAIDAIPNPIPKMPTAVEPSRRRRKAILNTPHLLRTLPDYATRGGRDATGPLGAGL